MIRYKGFRIIRDGKRSMIYRLGKKIASASTVVSAKLMIDTGEVWNV
jgi:hypothetical protein